MDKVKELWAKLVEKVKQHKKEAKIGAAAVAAILIGVLIYNHSNPEYTVDLSQIYKIECSGINGEGKLYISTINAGVSDDLVADILLKLYPKASNDFIKFSQYKKFLSDMKDNFKFNKEENVSNGDEITATASYDKSQAKALKLNFKNTTLKTTISYLHELIDGNTPITDDLKKLVDSNFETKASHLFESAYDTELRNLLAPMISYLDYSNIKVSFNSNEKYMLKSKDNKSDPAEFVYLYDLNITYSKYVYNFFEPPVEQHFEKSFVVALTLSDVYYSKSSAYLYDANCDSTRLEFTPTIYNNLDEAKQKILDQDKYDIEQL